MLGGFVGLPNVEMKYYVLSTYTRLPKEIVGVIEAQGAFQVRGGSDIVAGHPPQIDTESKSVKFIPLCADVLRQIESLFERFLGRLPVTVIIGNLLTER